jgi:hypothetical protein
MQRRARLACRISFDEIHPCLTHYQDKLSPASGQIYIACPRIRRPLLSSLSAISLPVVNLVLYVFNRRTLGTATSEYVDAVLGLSWEILNDQDRANLASRRL